MRKQRIVIFIIFAILVPLGIDYLIFGNSFSSNISNEAWAGFLGSYIGGLCTMISVFITIIYYKDADKQKEKAAVQPFLHVTVGGSDWNLLRGFLLPGKTDKKGDNLKQVNVTIKNIGNGFASILVIHTGANLDGLDFSCVIAVGDTISTYFMVDPEKLQSGLHFALQYVDSMRNEYKQEYEMKKNNSAIVIDCGYPSFLKERK